MRLALRMCVAGGCAALLAACGDITGSGRNGAELDRAMDRWNAQGIGDYRMTVRIQGGMIGGAAIVTVRDGVPVSVQPIREEGPEVPASFFAPFDTVEDLFHVLQVAHPDRDDRIRAEYHPQLGMPIDVYIDPETNVADEEHGFAIETFEPL